MSSPLNCLSDFVQVSVLEWGLRPNLPSVCIACLHELLQFSFGTIQLTLLAGWWTPTTLHPFLLPMLPAASGTGCDLVQTWSQSFRLLCKIGLIKLLLSTFCLSREGFAAKMQYVGLRRVLSQP